MLSVHLDIAWEEDRNALHHEVKIVGGVITLFDRKVCRGLKRFVDSLILFKNLKPTKTNLRPD